MKAIRITITFGYILIALIIGSIGYIWFNEWYELAELEFKNQSINKLRKEINDIHIRLIEFSLLGETVLDWDESDLENYTIQRIALDSVLCHFKNTYPVERIDSARYLLEDK